MIGCIGFKIIDKLQVNCQVRFNCKLHKISDKGVIKLQPMESIGDKGCIKFQPIHKKQLGER